MKWMLLPLALVACGGSQREPRYTPGELDCLADVELRADAAIATTCADLRESCLAPIEEAQLKESKECLESY